MFKGMEDANILANKVAAYFNDSSIHKSHGRRLDRQEVRAQKVDVEDLEDDQQLQEMVLTAYHLITLIFEKTPATKLLTSHHGRRWIKNWGGS